MARARQRAVSLAARAVGAAMLALCGALATAATDSLEAAIADLERGNFAAALPALRRLARQDDPRAQSTLAGLYVQGIGVSRDLRRAMGWYCRVAHHRAGGPEVMHAVWFLAEYFRTGGGVPGSGYRRGRREQEDPRKAYFWFTVMASQADLYDSVDAPSELLGRIGINAVGGVLFAEERAALEAAVRGWRPERPVADPETCLALPDGP